MSGIVIDVDTKSDAANKDLNAINRNLAQIISSSARAKSSLNNTTGADLKKMNAPVLSTVKSFNLLSRTAPQALHTVEAGAAKATSGLNGLRNAAVAVGTAFLAIKGVGLFYRMADDLTNIQNRLALVIKDSDELVRKQRELLDLSADTRASYKGTVDIFTDMSKSLENIGISERRVTNVIRTIQQAGALSGSGPEALRGALIQLNQGIASGTLRGEELNSVLEQMKYLGFGLSKTLNLDTGNLRKFAEEGKITTKVLLDVIESMGAETDRDFKRTAITIEQASEQLRQAITYFFGDLNKYYGFSDRFGKLLLRLAATFRDANTEVIAEIFNLKQSLKNYIDGFDLFSAAELTLKAALRFEITPLEALDKYQEYKSIKKKIDGFRNFFKKPIEIPVPSASKPLVDFAKVSVLNLVKLMPRVAGPVVTLVDNVVASFKKLWANFEAEAYDAINPTARRIEALAEFATGYLINDNILERSWVNLFKSKDIVSFRKNLEELNKARDTRKWDDFSYLIREAGTGFRSMLKPVEDLLIGLNLLDNRLLQLRNTRLDRIIRYFEIFGRVVKRIYQDVFATTVEPIFVSIRANVEAYANAIEDAFSDIFSERTGNNLASGLIRGLRRGIKYIVIDIPKALEFFGLESVFEKLSRNIKAGSVFVAKGLFAFIKGFVSGLADSLSDIVTLDNFEKIFEAILRGLQKVIGGVKDAAKSLGGTLGNIAVSIGIDVSDLIPAKGFIKDTFDQIYEATTSGLRKTSDYINSFAKSVKSTFLDVYDAIVGNSYWPDTIDGIVQYTDRLGSVSAYMERFKNSMFNTFQVIQEAALGMGNGVGEAVSEFTRKLKQTNWSQAMSTLSTSAGASIIAGFLIAFGDTRLKILSANYFASLFNGVLNNAFSVFGPLLIKSLAASTGELANEIIKGLVSTFDKLVEAAPTFLGSLAKALLPVNSALLDTLAVLPGIGTIISNKILYAVGVAAALFAIFTKDGGSKVKEAILGREATKKKPGKDGLVDYISPIFFKKNEEKGIIENLFGGKKMALAIAGVFAAALLDSVSLLDSLVVGLPLLGYALLGKDGGAALTRQFLLLGEKILLQVYEAGLGKIAAFSGTESLMYRLFAFPKTLFSSAANSSRGPISTAFSEMFGEVKKGITNLRKNSEDYAAGKLNLVEAFMTSTTTTGGSVPIVQTEVLKVKEKFSNLLQSIGNVSFNGKALSEYFSKTNAFVKSKVSGLRNAFNSADLSQAISASANGTYSKLTDMASKAAVLLSDGFLMLLSVLKNKFVLFAVLAGGISTVAFAASDSTSAIDNLTSSVGLLVVGLGALATLLLSLGKIKALSNVYSEASEGFKATTRSSKAYITAEALINKDFSAAQAALKRNEAIESAARKKAFEARMKQELLQIDKLNDKKVFAISDPKLAQATRNALDVERAAFIASSGIAFSKDNDSRVSAGQKRLEKQFEARRKKELDPLTTGAGLAGFSAVKDSVIASLSRLGDVAKGAGLSIFAFARNPKILLDWGKNALSSAENVQAGFQAVSLAAGQLGTGLRALRQSFVLLKLGEFAASFQLLTIAITSTSAALLGGLVSGPLAFLSAALGNLRSKGPKAFGELLKSALAFGAGLGKSLAKVGSALLGFFLKPVALVTAGVAAAGLAGLWLFGPGNTFIDNLEYAYDRAKALFGIKAKSETGRREELKSNLETREIGGVKSNFTADIARVNFAKLSVVQFDALTSAAAKTKEGLDNLAIQAAQEGGLDAVGKSEVERLTREMRQILLRAPANAKEDTNQKISKILENITILDNTLFGMFKRFVGYVPIVDQLSESVSGVRQAFMAFASFLKNTFVNKVTATTTAVGASIGLMLGPIGAIGGAVIGALLGGFLSFIGDAGVAGAIIGGVAFGPLGALLGIAIGKLLSIIVDAYNFGPFFKKFESTLKFVFSGIANVLTETVTAFYTDFKDAFTEKPTQEQETRKAAFDSQFSRIKKFGAELPAEAQQGINIALEEYNTALVELARLEKKGWTGVNFADRASFDKALLQARADFSKAEAQAKDIADVYGFEAEKLANIKLFKAEMKDLADETKSLQDVDIGKFGENFLGSKEQLQQLRDLNFAVGAYNQYIERSIDHNERLTEVLRKRNAQEEAKELVQAASEKAFFGSEIAYNIKITGVEASVAELTQLKLYSQNLYKEFADTSNALAQAQLNYKQAFESGDPANAARLYKEVERLRTLASSQLPGTIWLDDLNSKLQKLGVEAIKERSYLLLSTEQAENLRASLKNVEVAKAAIEAVRVRDGGLEKAQSEIDKYLRALDQLKNTAQTLIVVQIQSVVDGVASGAAKALKIADLTGVQVPVEIARSTGKTATYNKLIAQEFAIKKKISDLETDQRAGITGKSFSSDYARANTELYNTQKQLERLNDVSVLTLDSVISKASESGFEIDKAIFRGFGEKTKSKLIENAAKLEGIAKQLELSSASSLGGAGINKLLDKQAALLKDSGAAILRELKSTSAGYDQLFSKLGIDTEGFSRISAENLEKIADSFTEIYALTNAVTASSGKGPAAFLKATQKLADARKKLSDSYAEQTATFEGKGAKINEMLGTDLTPEDFAGAANSLYKALTGAAQSFSRDLRDVMLNGVTSAGQSASEFFSKLNALKTSGTFVSFFKSVGQSFKDALVEGAESGFKRITEVASGLGLAFEDFMDLAPATRRELSKESVIQTSLRKAADLPNLTPELANILNQLGPDNGSDVLKQFESAFFSTFGKSFSEATASPLNANTKATEDNTAAILGSISPGVSANSAAPAFGGGEVLGSFFKQLNARAKNNIEAPAQNDLGIRGTAARFSNFGVDKIVTELANPEELFGLTRFVNILENNKLKLANANDQQRRELIESSELAKIGLEELSSKIKAGVTKLRDAGQAFTENIKGDFQTAFSDLLKGKSDEGKSALVTFRDRLVDSFTNNLVDTFTKNLSDTIFKEDGLLGGLLSAIGANQASMGNGDLLTGLMTAASYKTDLGSQQTKMLAAQEEGMTGVFDSIKEAFSKGLESLKEIDVSSTFDSLGGLIKEGLSALSEIDFSSIFESIGPAISEGLSLLKAFAGYADGGKIAGPGTGRSDSIPAMLSNGEFVINAASTKRFEPLLRAINNNQIAKFANGGFVGADVMPVPVMRSVEPAASGSSSGSQTIQINITGDISRQTRSEIYAMLPQIANGVNSHNREKNLRK